MAYDFAGYPELGLAVPFENMSFSRWGSSLPIHWDTIVSPHGNRSKYSPGYAITPAVQIDETGVVADANNQINQELDALPDNIPNNQICRIGACILSDLGGSFGAATAKIKIYQTTGGSVIVAQLSLYNSTTWVIGQANETNAIVDTKDDISVLIWVESYSGSSNPAAAIDRFFIEYGRAYNERYYTFTR